MYLNKIQNSKIKKITTEVLQTQENAITQR